MFEHLQAPLQVAEYFHKILKPGGVLVFDYILSDGDGVDTVNSSRERQATLCYLREEFELVSGIIDENRSLGTTIVRRR